MREAERERERERKGERENYNRKIERENINRERENEHGFQRYIFKKIVNYFRSNHVWQVVSINHRI